MLSGLAHCGLLSAAYLGLLFAVGVLATRRCRKVDHFRPMSIYAAVAGVYCTPGRSTAASVGRPPSGLSF